MKHEVTAPREKDMMRRTERRRRYRRARTAWHVFPFEQKKNTRAEMGAVASALKNVGYTADIYDMKSLKWTQKAFTIPMVQGYERLLFNGTNYTVGTYLNDVRSRYGGVDAVLLWPTYMNIGLDDRDQLDLFEAMPGGLAGLKQLMADFHAAGVHVIWGYNPW